MRNLTLFENTQVGNICKIHFYYETDVMPYVTQRELSLRSFCHKPSLKKKKAKVNKKNNTIHIFKRKYSLKCLIDKFLI
jgi:hypothetical protein